MNEIALKTLYNQDFALWVEENVTHLKAREFNQIDWDNLIDEIESLAKSQRKAVRGFLVRLLELLLKRHYVLMYDCYRGWEIEIKNFRFKLKIELKDSPSLKDFILEILPKSYEIALENVKDGYPDTYFPDDCPFPNDVHSLLTEKFWEIKK